MALLGDGGQDSILQLWVRAVENAPDALAALTFIVSPAITLSFLFACYGVASRFPFCFDKGQRPESEGSHAGP